MVRHSTCCPPKGRTVGGGGSEHSGRITYSQSLGPTTEARASASRYVPLPTWAVGGSAQTPPPMGELDRKESGRPTCWDPSAQLFRGARGQLRARPWRPSAWGTQLSLHQEKALAPHCWLITGVQGALGWRAQGPDPAQLPDARSWVSGRNCELSLHPPNGDTCAPERSPKARPQGQGEGQCLLPPASASWPPPLRKAHALHSPTTSLRPPERQMCAQWPFPPARPSA